MPGLDHFYRLGSRGNAYALIISTQAMQVFGRLKPSYPPVPPQRKRLHVTVRVLLDHW